MESSVHTGHRNRLKERFRSEGLDNFNEINALELLLFYCVPRRDTNPLAHRLLKEFGSLVKVLEAPLTELMKVEGVTENVATYLCLVKEMSRYYMVSQNAGMVILQSGEACADHLRPHFIGRTDEAVYVLGLDAKCQVVCCKKVSEGTFNSAPFPTRKVVELVLSCRASSVIIAHNHPTGFAIPSPEDIRVTAELAKLLRGLDVLLVDHLVYANDGDYVSMYQSGCYEPSLAGDPSGLEAGR